MLYANATVQPASLGSASSMSGPRAVAYVAFIFFGVAAVVLPIVAIGRRATARLAAPWLLPQRFAVQALACALLACGWFFAGLNALLWNGGSIARVLLNALAWDWTLGQLAEFYEVREPTRTAFFQPIRRGALLVLVLAAFSDESARLVALTAVLPLAVVTGLCATLWASNADRAAWWASSGASVPGPPRHDLGTLVGARYPIRPGAVLLGVVGALGLYVLITEALSKEYAGVLPLTASFALMLPAHAVLALLWNLMALVEVADASSGTGTHADGDDFDPRGAVVAASVLDDNKNAPDSL